jgi:hypothetical protein
MWGVWCVLKDMNEQAFLALPGIPSAVLVLFLGRRFLESLTCIMSLPNSRLGHSDIYKKL